MPVRGEAAAAIFSLDQNEPLTPAAMRTP